MKRNGIVLCLILCILTSGCGNASKNEKTASTTTQQVTTEAASASSDADSQGSQADVWNTYYQKLSLRYSEPDASNETGDTANDCVALKSVMTTEQSDLIMVSPYRITKKGYLAGDAISFEMLTYQKHGSREDQTKVLYADYNFINSKDKVKGYAVIDTKNTDIILCKCSDDQTEYIQLKRDGTRYIKAQCIQMGKKKYQIDDEMVAKEKAVAVLETALDQVEAVLLKEGVLDQMVMEKIKGKPDCTMNPHAAKEMCQYQAAVCSSKEVSQEQIWKNYAGSYTTSTGKDTSQIVFHIKKDGTFSGEYKNEQKNQKLSSSFSGSFQNGRELEKDSYYLQCEDFHFDRKTPSDQEASQAEYEEPEELRTMTQLILYQKGIAMEQFPDVVKGWFEVHSFLEDKEMPEKTDRAILYNPYTRSYFYEMTEEND